MTTFLVGDGYRSRLQKLQSEVIKNPPKLEYKNPPAKKKKRSPVMIYIGNDTLPYNRNPVSVKEL